MAATQVSFRGRNDDGNETTATWKANQDVNWTQQVDTNFRVRFLVQNATSAINNLDVLIQYQLNGGGWNAVSGSSNVVRSSASPNLADQANLTQQLTGGTGTFIGATCFDEANGICGGTSLDVTATGNFECEFSVQIRSADVQNGDTVELRTINNDTGTAWGAYTNIPAITVAASASKTPLVGALSVAGTTSPQNIGIIPQTGALTITGQAVGMLPAVMNTKTAALTLVGKIPIVTNVARSPPAGELFLGLDHPQTGSLTLTGYAPTVQEGGGGAANTDITPTVGSLTLSGNAPSLLQNNIVTPSAGALSISGNAPSLSTAGVITPSAGSLTLTGNAPTVSQGSFRAATVGSLTLSGMEPSVVQGPIITPSAGSLTISGNAPSLLTDNRIIPGAGSLIITGNPPASGSFITPGCGSLVLGWDYLHDSALTITGYAPTVQSSAGTTITPQAGELRIGLSGIGTGAGSLVITGQTPTLISNTKLTPTAGSLTISGNAPNIVQGRLITPTAGALTITGVAPSLIRGSVIQPTVGALSLSGNISTLSTDTRIAPSAGALTLTGFQPDIQISSAGNTNRTPSGGTLAITGQAGRNDRAIRGTVGALTISGNAPSPVQGTLKTPSAGALTIAGIASRLNLSIAPSSGSLTITGNQPNVQVSSAGNTNRTPNGGALVITGNAPTVRQQVFFTPSAGSLTLTGAAASLIQNRPILPSSGVVTITGDSPVTIASTAIMPSSGALVLASDPPTMTAAGTFIVEPQAGALTITGAAPVPSAPPIQLSGKLVGDIVLSGKVQAGGDIILSGKIIWEVNS